MGKVFFYCRFAYIVIYGQSFDCGVVYNNFFYAVFLAVRKAVVIKIDCPGIFFVVSMAEKQVYTADCAERKKCNSRIFKKAFYSVRNNQGKLGNFYYKNNARGMTDCVLSKNFLKMIIISAMSLFVIPAILYFDYGFMFFSFNLIRIVYVVVLI